MAPMIAIRTKRIGRRAKKVCSVDSFDIYIPIWQK